MKLSKKLSSISISLAAISTFASVNSLQADEYKKGIYSNIGVGAGTYSDILWTTGAVTPFDYGISLDFGLGYDFGKRFRTELSYTNTTSERETGNQAKFNSIILNGYLDFPIENTKFTPFIGVGFGTTGVDANNLCFANGANDCDDDVATYSFSGGLAYGLNDTTELTAKLTYLGFDDININNNGTRITVLESETLSFHIGARVKF